MPPLSETDLDRLERYLTAPERSESTLPLDAVQGLLCAAVSAPAPVLPSKWLPEVLGEAHEFATEEEARDITELLIHLHNDVADQLNQGEGFDFILYGGEGEDAESTAVWCEGYLMGVDLAEPSWEQEADPDALDEMLYPFLVLAGHSKEQVDEKALEELRATLADDVLANQRYWFAHRIPDTVRRATPKVGRNDPCPCGSGKKYKNCHGS